MKEELISPPDSDNVPLNIELTGTSYCDETYHITREHSEITCIEYIISGSGTVHCNDTTVYPRQGDMYILPCGKTHDYYADAENPWVKIWINVNGSLAEYLLGAYGLGNICMVKDCNGSEYIYKIQKLCQSQRLSPYEIQSKCAEEFFSLVQFISSRCRKDIKNTEAVIIKEYIDKNFSENITLEMLSELISHSISQTIRIFRNEYGITPYEYIITKRIDVAKLMIKNTNLKIKDISSRVGFYDEHYFSLIFRRRSGYTPLKYRKS